MKIMMYGGSSVDGELFDATRWFANGMYRRYPYRDGRPGLSNVGMTRVSPPPFPDTQLEDLRNWIAMALEEPDLFTDLAPVPSAAIRRVEDQSFDPRPQIIYVSSGFSERDVPQDSYIFYMLHDGKRYFAYLDRDPMDGELIGSSRALGIIGSEKEDRLFQELEEHEKLTAWRNASGLRTRSGERCPHPGVWECLECGPGTQNQRHFEHDAVLPQVDGRDVTWRMLRAYE